MANSRKKKKRSQWSSNHQHQASCKTSHEEEKAVNSLMEAFASVSLQEANGDLNKAAEIFEGFTADEKLDSQTVSCSSSSSSSGSLNWDQGWPCAKDRAKHKKVVAATGMVSSVIANDYVSSRTPRKDSKFKEVYAYEPLNKVDAEQFLCSMLGEDCELSLAVVRDVLCQCGYDVQKALNTLLELCASSFEHSENGQTAESFAGNSEETELYLECTYNLSDRASDSTSLTCENDSQDNEWIGGYRCRKYSEVLTGSGVQPEVGVQTSKSELPGEVLKALYNMPKRSEFKRNAMNWKDIVKKMESLGQRFECAAPSAAESELVHAEGDEYQVFRKTARKHWDEMKSYYHKAAVAFSNGEREYASHLSEQGRLSDKMAREADEKASKEIFRARNRSIENVITFDLHGQHVRQAMRLLKVHLLFGAYACSVQIFRVITGCGGSHGMAKSKLKQSVIDLVEREGIEWREENRGTILIRLDGQREFAFMESEDDID